jgi:hypothetical protein
MKVEYAAKAVIESAGVVEKESVFSIAETPHMFNILSSGLYSDKVCAVLREIGCNAMDAHIMAGTPDRPFEVKLPTTLDRTFYIKDWGPGLSDDEVRGLYTTYGLSNKQASDEVTGAFGLGSKSPFAYTDSFTVCAAKDGVKRVYTAYLGAGGAPAIVRIFEGPSDPDWPNGVMVTFPVQQKDISEFVRKAASVYCWFSVKPKVLGLDAAKLATPEFAIRGAFYGICARGDNKDVKSSAVVTGNVRYPLELSKLGLRGERVTVYESLFRTGVTLFLPIGEVLMTPSREHLQYTERTKRKVIEWLDRVAEDLAGQLITRASQPGLSPWGLRQSVHELVGELAPVYREWIGLLVNGSDAPESIRSQVVEALKQSFVELPAVFGLKEANPPTANAAVVAPAKVPPHELWMLHTYRLLRGGKSTVMSRPVVNGYVRSGRSQFLSKAALQYDKKYAIVYRDASYSERRVRQALLDGVFDAVLLVKESTNGTSPKAVAEALASFPGPTQGLPVVAASSLPAPQPQPGKAKSGSAPAAVTVPPSLANQSFQLISLATMELRKVRINDIKDDTERYYAIWSRKERGFSVNPFYNNFRGIDVGTLRYGAPARCLQAAYELAKLLDIPVGGVLMLPTPGLVKRLGLEKQGFRPFLPALSEALREKLAPLAVDKSAEVPLYVATMKGEALWRWGLYAVFLQHRIEQSPFWSLFELNFEGSKLMQGFEKACPRLPDEKLGAAVDKDLEVLRSCLTHVRLPDDTKVVPSLYGGEGFSPSEAEDVPYAVAPLLRCLDVGEFAQMADREPERALHVLKVLT